MEANLAELLTRAGLEEPGKTALSEADTGRSMTWADLDELARRVAQGLFDAGLVAGMRVMIVAGNRIEAVAAYLGTLRAGMVAVPVDPAVSTGELLRTLVDSGARLVVCDGAAVTTVRAAVQGLGEALVAARREESSRPRIVTVGTTVLPGERGWDQLVMGAGHPVPVRPDGESLAALLYTSGASGRPRAAMLTHRALLANVEQVASATQPMLHGRDVVLGVLPLHHSYGLGAVLGQVLRQHARLVLVDGFAAEASLDLIEDEAITVAPVAPRALDAWLLVPALEERMGPLRLVLSGSAALGHDVAEEFTRRTGLPVHQGYGLTECGPVVTSTLVGEEPASTGSVGRPLPGVGLRLVDDRGEPPVEGDPGQILVHGPQLFSGYWPEGRGGPDADGWWNTGDVGLLDGAGELHLVDRVSDVVVVSGFQVFPTEVEEVIAELADVGAVAVVGVDDDRTGEAVVVYVTHAADADLPDPDELEGRVRRHCEARLAGFKVPAVVRVTDDLPRTATGKIQRGRLRAEARGRESGLLR